MTRRHHPSAGSTLVITLVTLTALSLMAAYTLVRVMPRVRMAYQNAAWQEARVAAEAGVDIAMNDLLVNASGTTPGSWPGWQKEPPPPGITQPQGLLKKLSTSTGAALTKILGKLAKKSAKNAAPDYTVTSTAPIYLDNIKVSAQGGVASDVDVRLWGLQPNAAPHTQWFRIRSTATCALPPRAFDVPANLDALLRRFSLRSVRSSLKKDQAGLPSSVGLPNVTRTVEALVEPIYPFELGLWTSGAISLSATGAWNIDSFDSSDDTKSAAGLYPGRGQAFIQSNGNVATSLPRPFTALYGPLVEANGVEIRGAVATNGGDDPATDVHENVTGAGRVDPKRIRSDFSREMPTIARPTSLTALPSPVAGAPFTAGPADAPSIYAIPGSVTQLRIAAPTGQIEAGIVIMIDGDLDLAGPLILPPAVTALLYVRGNITFRDSVNSGPWSSNRAGQLLIFGDSVDPARQTLQALGAISVTAAFYGPRTDISLDGGATWCGALAGSTFRVNFGGEGGLHYDEALATAGMPISFRISRYIEDVRE